jgi:hypothetical protein
MHYDTGEDDGLKSSVGHPIAVESLRHANRKTDTSHRLRLDLLRVEDDEIACISCPIIDEADKPAGVLAMIRRCRNVGKLTRQPALEIVPRGLARFQIIFDHAAISRSGDIIVSLYCVDDCVRATGETVVDARKLDRAVVEKLFFRPTRCRRNAPGGANVLRATTRVTFWGALAMAFTTVVGKLFGTVI